MVLGAVAAACARETSDAPSTDPRSKPPGASPIKPASTAPIAIRTASHGMPGPLTPEPGFEHGKKHETPPAVNVKHTGNVGELLEGDVYFFRLVSIKPCGEQPDTATVSPTARRVMGAEVEVTAKQEMNLSPRDVSIGVGGIVFSGSVDQKRKLEGCAPLLKIMPIKPKQVARGFVLFDIPVTGPGSDLAEMGLIYQPTRFGGAGRVLVRPLTTPVKPSP
jgi:hypothetical protein